LKNLNPNVFNANLSIINAKDFSGISFSFTILVFKDIPNLFVSFYFGEI
jgi:hypothetical protein